MKIMKAALFAAMLCGCYESSDEQKTTDPSQAYVCQISGADQDRINVSVESDRSLTEIAHLSVDSKFAGYKVCLDSRFNDIKTDAVAATKTQFILKREADGSTSVFATTGNVTVGSALMSNAKLTAKAGSDGAAIFCDTRGLTAPATCVIDGWIERR